MVPNNSWTLGADTKYSGQTTRLCLLLVMCLGTLPCGATKRRFTVADDIELTHFAGDPYTGGLDYAVRFSPDGLYFLVYTARGLLDQNRPESTLRVFRTEDVHQFLLHPEATREPSPVWILSKSTYKDGPIITRTRWLEDSSGVAFLATTASGKGQLLFADLKTKTVHSLTPEDQDVTAFDIRNPNHFVFSIRSPFILDKLKAESNASSIVGTGRSLDILLFPMDPSLMSRMYDLCELWAVVNGRRFPVEQKSSRHPLTLYSEGQTSLSLSPDGRSVVTALALETIPPEWETLYPPPLASYPYRIKAGRQDRNSLNGTLYVSEYVLINLGSGEVKSLTNAPTGSAAGWWPFARTDWSADGESVVLPDTFVPTKERGVDSQPNRPCVAVANLVKGDVSCLERLKGEVKTKNGVEYEDGYHMIRSVRFDRGPGLRVIVDYWLADNTEGSTTYVRSNDASWRTVTSEEESTAQMPPVAVSVKESLNDPPVLIATDNTTKSYRVIWDPNPQLKDIDMGEVSVFKWKDNAGNDRVGGLYKPPDFVKGRRYPLVIQTHGFINDSFLPSGLLPTAFAAQELAAAEILVLQVQDCIDSQTPEEGPCQVATYETAVERLVADGLVDPDRIGIIGFSRSCYWVLEALTASAPRFRAASITDGVNEGYLQYITNVDTFSNWVAHEADATIGARPFGEGLHQWLKRSPGFNMDKVTTPLQVVAPGWNGLLEMWEPYAALRYLEKPVDLIVLPEGTHVLTNPAERLASQSGTVDWFRFWLKGEEDPSPVKAEQYVRWRELRKLQGTSVKPDASGR
jgi:dipeptidyl aminopeptidase/acylaminoacyl peptidase